MILRTLIIFILGYSSSYAQSEYLEKELKPIKDNFKRINSISNWTDVKKKELWDTTEGGEINYYYKQDSLLKIVVRNFGETRQSIHEFYLLKGSLSFSFYKEIIYNRPITWDSTSMLEINDNQVFDFDKSDIEEERNYFINNELIHHMYNKDCGSPFSEEFLEQEQKEITSHFNYLLNLSK